ncbi:MAG TPA: C4-dicarboxylate TRAP transporter substrate-binding protein [Alphaproteobacteria bacterium]|nr:C4-dicarboxylate TRAP transporter substrate-binding protein [Alphaproteobacteria bacterium]
MLKSLKATLAGLAFLCAGAGQTALAQDYPSMTFRYATGYPEALYMNEPAKWFARELEERSGGKIKVRMFFGGTLGKSNEILDLVSKGAVDMGSVVQGYFNSQLPFAAMTNSLPMTFFDGESAMRVAMKLDRENPDQIAEYERNNIKPLVNRFLPNYQLICTQPVRTVADLEGLKIRTFGSYMPIMFSALKATPVNILPVEMYEALKRGSLDCSYLTPAFFQVFKLYEVAPYVIDVKFGAINAYWLAINKRKFDSLPQKVQDLIVQTGQDATEWGVKHTYETEEKSLTEVLADDGVELIKFEEQEKLEDTVPDMIGEWIAEMAKLGKEAEARAYAETVRKELGL